MSGKREQGSERAMTDTTSVITEKRGQAFWITINRRRNATH
ncbi:hypothetical protein ACVWXO_006110 [Bradyrhizobium sp. LM2.7]